MSDLNQIFTDGAKVVISPDKMRAWVMLPPPAGGVKYTIEAVTAWLPQNGVVYGADQALIRAALASRKYHELLEVARGDAPVPASGGGYTLMVEKRPFTGLSGNPDGSLHYENLGFLQEVPEGKILAEIFAPHAGAPGKTVTGEPVEPKEVDAAQILEGSGYAITDEGRYYRAPVVSHVSIANDQLIVTPVLKLGDVKPDGGPVQFEGNVLVEGDVHSGSSITATGSIFVKGKCTMASLNAGRHVLLCEGMRSAEGIGVVEAKENVWGKVFESVDITAGGDLCSNHLIGCEANVQGRANILGGRGQISNTEIYAKGGVVAQKLGSERREATTVKAGMDAELIERNDSVENRIGKITVELQSLQQNITAFERINKNKPDKGKKDPKYLEMVGKRDQLMSVLNILSNERTRIKRIMDQFSAVSVIARDSVWPGLTVVIDTRVFEVQRDMQKCKFKRDQDVIKVVALQQGR